jgi:hypothetical protein
MIAGEEMPMEGMGGEREGLTWFGGGVETKTGERADEAGEVDGKGGEAVAVTARTGRAGRGRVLPGAKVGETDGRAEVGGGWEELEGDVGATAKAGIAVAGPAVCSQE